MAHILHSVQQRLAHESIQVFRRQLPGGEYEPSTWKQGETGRMDMMESFESKPTVVESKTCLFYALLTSCTLLFLEFLPIYLVNSFGKSHSA